MKLWKEAKWTFGKLTLLEMASSELAEAERGKMEAETAKEFADASVTYNTARIKRLRAQINEITKTQKEVAA